MASAISSWTADYTPFDRRNPTAQDHQGIGQHPKTIILNNIPQKRPLHLGQSTRGLHLENITRLLTVLNQLVEEGNTVLVVEHHLDVIKCADWVVNLGPGGGESGGHIVAQGTPEDIAKSPESITGKYLKPLLFYTNF